MKFDVIIGNPPYQMNDGGGMEQAPNQSMTSRRYRKKIATILLSMIIPSRWFSGGGFRLF